MPAGVTITSFFRPLKYKFPCGIELADVASAVPAFFADHRLKFMPGPISGGNAAASDQNFSIWSQLDLAPRQHFSNRPFAQAKGMVHADDRSGFGETVALNYGVTHPSPELFGHAVERRTAADKCPELPSELAMNAPEDPPAEEKVLSFAL